MAGNSHSCECKWHWSCSQAPNNIYIRMVLFYLVPFVIMQTFADRNETPNEPNVCELWMPKMIRSKHKLWVLPIFTQFSSHSVPNIYIFFCCVFSFQMSLVSYFILLLLLLLADVMCCWWPATATCDRPVYSYFCIRRVTIRTVYLTAMIQNQQQINSTKCRNRVVQLMQTKDRKKKLNRISSQSVCRIHTHNTCIVLCHISNSFFFCFLLF